jgi:hypothetical protein
MLDRSLRSFNVASIENDVTQTAQYDSSLLANSNYKMAIDGLVLTHEIDNPTDINLINKTITALIANGTFKGGVVRRGQDNKNEYKIPTPIDSYIKSGSILLQLGSNLSTTASMRVDAKPTKVDSNAFSDLIDVIDRINPRGAAQMLLNSTFTRVDIALDLYGMKVDDLIIRSTKSRKHGVYSNQNGVPETVYIGTPRTNRTVLYERKKSRDGQAVARIERRLKQRYHGYDVVEIDDPFAQIQLVDAAALIQYLGDIPPEFFFDYARVRGINRAIKRLDLARQKKLKAILNDPRQSRLPLTSDVWKGWRQLLHQSGLGCLVQ